MVLPATALLIATAVSAAAKGAGDYFGNKSAEKQGKRRAKETERETHANLIHEALQRSAELKAHQLASRQKLGKRRATASHDTGEIVRGALTI